METVEKTIGTKFVADIKVSTLKTFYSDMVSGRLVVDGERKQAYSDGTLHYVHKLILGALEVGFNGQGILKEKKTRAGRHVIIL